MGKTFSVVSLLAALSIGLVPTLTDAQPFDRRYDGYKIVRIAIEDASDLQTLERLDAASPEFQIWTDYVGLGSIDVRLSPGQKPVLDASGLSYTIQVEDWQRQLEQMFKGAGEPGFFDSYRTHNEHIGFLYNLADTYPDLAEVFTVGRSVEGRFMWAIRITGPGEDKPGVLYHGGQHGNEVLGPVVVAYLAEYLLTRYDTDPEVRALVDNVEWFLLTIMNPDGYEANGRSNANGYDLNRNWGGPGAQPNPFSQPETAAMRDLLLAHPNIRVHLDFHTFGRMILWPWGHSPDLCIDNPTYETLGDDMAELIFQFRGSDYDERGPAYTTIYPVYGGSIDYSYGELGLWAIVYELGNDYYGHSQPISEIMPTCQELTPAMLYLAEFVSDCNQNDIRDDDEIAGGQAEDCNANHVPDECEVFALDFDDDGVLDPCDPDLDGDGVPNGSDDCEYTPLGVVVDANGRPISDVNDNCLVGLYDFIRVGFCLDLSGPGTPAGNSFCTTYFDYDGDSDIDLEDAAGFARAFTGEP